MDLHDWIDTADSIKAILQLHKTSIFLQVLTSCILIASIPITANLQTRESSLKLLHGECDNREWIFNFHLYVHLGRFYPRTLTYMITIRMSRSRWEAPDDSGKNSPQGKSFLSALKSINYE